MNLFNDASLIITPNATKAGKLYAIKPTSGAGDLTVVRATTATRVNSAGLIESVAVNVPRLDYTNSTCPSILVEPQRTNISNYVESGTGSFNQATVVSAPNILGLTAFKVTPNIGVFGDFSYVNLNLDYQANIVYTGSFYTDFSKCTGDNVILTFLGFFPSLGFAGIEVNKTTKAITTINFGGVWTLNSFKAEQINGEIYKIICTATPNATSLGGSRTYIYTNNLLNFEVAGIQVEASNYATSFIKKPSTASVTRNADVISKTGISSLIGQTEGTLYTEIKVNKLIGTASRYIFHISDGTANNRIYMAFSGANSNIIRARIFNAGTLQCSIDTSTLTNTGTYKIALAYKNNDIVFYVNGVQIGTDTSATIPTCNRVDLGQNYAGASQLGDSINNANIWKTRLTNTELATLTTI